MSIEPGEHVSTIRAGYVTDPGSGQQPLTQVVGGFTVPTAASDVVDDTAAFWVGFDGYLGPDQTTVEQAAVTGTCLASSVNAPVTPDGPSKG